MSKIFSKLADSVAHAAGHPIAFALCVASIVLWATSGPFFGFSETWQLIINTGTTIVTFLMVFLLQSTQNRDGAAIQAKLDEIIRSSAARNSFIGIDHLTPEELEEIRTRCEARARAAAESDKAVEAADEKAEEAVRAQRA